MPVVRVTKEFSFEMAHALQQYNGDCKNIHGHSYALEVTLKGPVQQFNGHENGMVMDFSMLKTIIKKEVIDDFDHALVLQDTAASSSIVAQLKAFSPKLHIVSFTPTCENLLAEIYRRIIPHLPGSVILHRIMLRETATSYAEFYAEDN